MAKLALKFVNTFRDRHGRLRHYFRRRGGKTIPLPGLPGSEEFMQAYQAAIASAGAAPQDIGASRTQPGTIDALVVVYYRGAWTSLDAGTHRIRRPVIERFRTANGGKRVALLQRSHIEVMMATLPNIYARRLWLQTIRHLLQSAIPLMLKVDPTEGLKVKIPKTDGHHTWTDEEIQRYRNYWRLGTQQRLVFEFALEAASRRCEVLRLGPQHIKNGRIRIERAKGSHHVDILVTPELQAAIDAMPKGQLLYVVNQHGRQRSVEGLGVAFGKWATEAGLPKRCRLHGLKKGGLRRLAESQATTHELMSVSGHKTLRQLEVYTKEVDRKKLADSGMKKRISNS
jgi:integrase